MSVDISYFESSNSSPMHRILSLAPFFPLSFGGLSASQVLKAIFAKRVATLHGIELALIYLRSRLRK